MGKALLCGMRRSAVSATYGLPASGLNTNSTEALSAAMCRIPGRFSNLGINIDAAGTGLSYKFRKNSANGNQSISPPDSTAGFYADAANADVLAVGDTFDIAYASTGSPVVYGLRAVFEANNAHGTYFIVTDSGAVVSNNWFIPPCGAIATAGSLTESDTAAKARSAGTLANLQLYVSANSSPTNVTIKTRINGFNGNCSITVPSGATGFFEDTVNSDAIADGDIFCLQSTGKTGGGSLTIRLLGLTFATTITKNDLFSSLTAARSASATTHYVPIAGQISTSTGTLTEAQMRHGFPGRCSKLRVNVIDNTYSANATVRLVKNGVSGNQVLTITAGNTGWFEDAVNSDTFLPDDDIAISVVGGTSGNMTATIFGLTEVPDVTVYGGQMGYGENPSRIRTLAY